MRNYTRRAPKMLRGESDGRIFKIIAAVGGIILLITLTAAVIKARIETPKEVTTTPVTTSSSATSTSTTTPAATPVATPVVDHGPTYPVSRVIDGDTLDVEIKGTTYRVRLIGVNTPETVHPSKPQECYGLEASNFMKNLLTGQKVALESDSSQGDTDKYGRLLRYVFFNDENINLKLISDGYGYEYTYNTSYKYQSDFRAAQSLASQQGRGLWSAC